MISNFRPFIWEIPEKYSPVGFLDIMTENTLFGHNMIFPVLLKLNQSTLVREFYVLSMIMTPG